MSRSAAQSSPNSPHQHGVVLSSETQSPSGSPSISRSTPPSHPRPLPGAFFGDYVNSFARGGKKKKRLQHAAPNENILDLRELAEPSVPTKRSSRSPLMTPGSHTRSVNSSVRQTPVLRPLRGLEPPTKILDFLFLGTVYDAQDANFLAQNNIRYIINVSTEEYWSADKRVVVYPFKILDTVDTNISTIFKDTRNIIERCRQEFFKAKRDGAAGARRRSAGGSVVAPAKVSQPPLILVHCQKGRSRSATIVLAYLVYRNGWSVAEALDYVAKLRPVVEPNLGFMDALRELQESMDPDERNRRCGQQSLCIRNIPLTTTPATVASFFEDRVGLVRNVLMHGLPAPKSSRPSHIDVVPKPTGPVPAPRSSTPQATAGATAQVNGATPLPEEPVTPAMCLIMFACFENVKRAKEYAESHMPELERVLGTVPGKAVKLMVPIKLRPTTASLTSSFVNPAT